MGWASGYIEALKAGRTVQFRPRGSSMEGKISSGQLCALEPINDTPLKIGDVVLCKVRGREFLHLVKGTRQIRENAQFLIGNNKGGVNGWIGRGQVFGIVTKVED